MLKGDAINSNFLGLTAPKERHKVTQSVRAGLGCTPKQRGLKDRPKNDKNVILYVGLSDLKIHICHQFPGLAALGYLMSLLRSSSTPNIVL